MAKVLFYTVSVIIILCSLHSCDWRQDPVITVRISIIDSTKTFIEYAQVIVNIEGENPTNTYTHLTDFEGNAVFNISNTFIQLETDVIIANVDVAVSSLINGEDSLKTKKCIVIESETIDNNYEISVF